MRSLSGYGLGDDSVDLSSAFSDITDSSGTVDSGTISESPYPVVINSGPVTVPANSTGQLTPTQLVSLIGGAAAAGSQVIRSTQSPSVIPGSNLVYNPATGQMVSATGVGVGVGVGTPAISAGISLSPILIVIALVAVVGFMGGKK